ncbi:MAG TPA: hypothetical protein VHM02_07510 [Thermoanaerobaculia bacterium]|nr:hypothetical protein [Thermoanaerobaculia bacterium]
MERYRVKFPTAEAYRRGLGIAEARVPVLIASEKRHVLSIGELPPDLEADLRSLGASVTQETRYELEVVGG